MTERSESLWRLMPLYVVCYLCWFAFFAVTLWTVLQYRNVILELVTVVGPWVIGAIDKFGLVLFTLAALAWIIYLENYLREGVGKGLLWRRLLRVAIIQLVALGIAYVLQLVEFLLI